MGQTLRWLAALLLAVAAWCAACQVRADAPRPLRFEAKRHLPIAIGASVLWASSELLLPSIAPRQCRWCEDNAIDRSVRAALLWDHSARAARISDYAAFLAAPLVAFGGVTAAAAGEGAVRHAWLDLLVIGEAVSLSALLNQVFKLSVARQRPFVHAGAEPGRGFDKEDNLSFYSGHTNLAFALVVSAGTVASMRGYRAAPVLWGVGVPIAVLAGAMRISADRHYFSDVLVGAVLGTAMGALIPYLLHRPRAGTAPMLSAGPSSMAVTFAF